MVKWLVVEVPRRALLFDAVPYALLAGLARWRWLRMVLAAAALTGALFRHLGNVVLIFKLNHTATGSSRAAVKH